METIKKYFPLSFKEKSEVRDLILNILVYLAGAIVVGILIGVCSGIPVVNWMFGILGTLAELYIVGGIAFSALNYFKIIK